MNLKEAEKLFLGGCSDDAYRYLGAHPAENGYVFRVYAPNARSVRLVGDFNGWNTTVPPMERDADSSPKPSLRRKSSTAISFT